MAWTFPELEVVAPEARMISPALVRALLASEADLPTTLGTVQGVSGFSAPRYKMMEALLGTMVPPTGVWSVTVAPSPTVVQVKPALLSRVLASSSVIPTTLGTVVSAPASSSAVYSGSMPRYGSTSLMIELATQGHHSAAEHGSTGSPGWGVSMVSSMMIWGSSAGAKASMEGNHHVVGAGLIGGTGLAADAVAGHRPLRPPPSETTHSGHSRTLAEVSSLMTRRTGTDSCCSTTAPLSSRTCSTTWGVYR